MMFHAGALAALVSANQSYSSSLSALRAQAARVTIVRDDWGIAHVHGKTDADAVFGMVYAQAEDDFNRVEMNYVTALGRLAEIQGPTAIYTDLRTRLFTDPADLQNRYRSSPPFLRRLMDAWAAGLNYYLATHPAVHPHLLMHFEPWMALSFSEGSIGGDIERIPLDQLQQFYGGGETAVRLSPQRARVPVADQQGSNGIAIAPSDTAGKRYALLLINPHTSFYFRSELQMSSDEGLDAYGAVTWGQFFIYQGFNQHVGWMHTSSRVDNVDRFAETIVHRGGKLFYRYGSQERPVSVSTITIRYRLPDGSLGSRIFAVYRTHHGPIVGSLQGRWIAQALMYRPVAALMQSYLRTKAVDLASYEKVAQLRANSSNNTIFADGKGEIAYLHPQFIPRRDNRFDYTKPVDGSNPATDWHGLLSLDEEPHVVNPEIGWVFNTNDWPYSSAGPDSPKRADFPRYMDTGGENARGVHASMMLAQRRNLTLQSLLAIAFDSHLPLFDRLVPQLVQAYDALAPANPLKTKLADPLAQLRGWDRRWAADSIPTSLAMFWADSLARSLGSSTQDALVGASPAQKLSALGTAVDRITSDFGTWRTPWGAINRFQRLNDDITPEFSDAAPSIPVPFVSGLWGSLAAFYAAPLSNTKRWYGTSGNSFVAVVEFGKRVRAVAVTAGGESGHPNSPHFDDEAVRYSTGRLRRVYFYPDELVGHTERTYHPGE